MYRYPRLRRLLMRAYSLTIPAATNLIASRAYRHRGNRADAAIRYAFHHRHDA